MVHEIFYDYLSDFMKVYVDDFSVAGVKAKHNFHLRVCLQRCRDTSLKINPKICALVVVRSGGFVRTHCVKGRTSNRPKKGESNCTATPTRESQTIGMIRGKGKMIYKVHQVLGSCGMPILQADQKGCGVCMV